jgi:tRNA-dihydrouridine synthase
MREKDTLILAPIRGVTDCIFRTVLAEMVGGFDRAMAPFIRTQPGGAASKTLSDVEPRNNPALPVIPQILSKNSDDFVSTAGSLAALGHQEVNWNLGCPHLGIAKKGMGAFMLAHPDKIDRFLERVFSQTTIGISIKTRLGLDAPDQLLRVLPVLDRYPLTQLIIHPRTASQMYGGKVDLERFEACLEETRLKVVYNGDIVDQAGFERLRARFGTVDHWMIGRGAVGDPFLAMRIAKQPVNSSDGSELKKIKQLHDELYKRYQNKLSGPAHLLAKMKAIWQYFALAAADNGKLRKKIQKVKSPQRYEGLVQRLFKS